MKPPKASPAKVKYHLQQLHKMFERSDDHAFLQMVWAVDALQSDREQAAAAHLTYPPAAADSSIGAKFAIHQWELETLLVQLFLTPKHEIQPGPNLILNCRLFDSMRETINRLRSLENVESAMYLKDRSIFNEMHRIAHRQFHWQRGYLNIPQMYRYTYLYGQGQCADYFQRTHGLAITDLNFVAFGLYASYLNQPWVRRTFSGPEIGLTTELVQQALPLLALPLHSAREETAAINAEVTEKHGGPIPTAYLPSLLRRYPIVSTDDDHNLLIAPIPEVLLIRVTASLYYDLIPGGQHLLNEANDRFEQYCADFIPAVLPRFTTSRSYKYGQKGAQIDTPDVLVKDNGKLIVVAECKATKLNYLAQFAEDPFDAEKKQYDQIARGVFQVWRFFSHIRRGQVKEELADDVYTMVITLDSFLLFSRELKAKVLEQAKALADAEKDILDEDRRPVVFCPIHDLETIMQMGTEDSFLGALKASQEEKFIGWQLREIHRDYKADQERTEPKKFPFSLDNVLPWWKNTREIAQAMEAPADAPPPA